MTQAYIDSGDVIECTAAADVAVGDVVVVEDMVVVAKTAAATGEKFRAFTRGRFATASKTAGQEWKVGERLFLNSATGAWTNVSAQNLLPVASVAAPAAAAATAGEFRLDGVVFTAVP